MSGFFWMLWGVNAVFAALVGLALPWGPDLVYGVLAGTQLGLVFILGWKERDRQREWDHF